MSQPAVIFDNVSKLYQLRHFKSGSLKDNLTDSLRRLNPFGPKADHTPNASIEEFWALKGVSFQIRQGEAVGIIGPNGSGKSTTLKILSNVIRPTSGISQLNGRLGALIEVGAGFHPELSGRENVFLNGSILGMSKAEIKRKFDSIVDFAEIEQFIDTPVKHYSSGMYVRLGFSVAVHNEPEIMLVDEVLAVGDLAFQKKCFAKMEEMKDSGRTFILVSHNMQQIQALCGRAILLHKGKLVGDGDPNEISGKYIEIANTKKPGATPANKQTDDRPVTVHDIRLVGPDGAPRSTLEIGEPISLEIDYTAKEPIQNPTIVLNVKRDSIRLWSSNTRILGIKFGTLIGQGKLRCQLPAMPLIPNALDVGIGFWDASQDTMYCYTNFPKLFTIQPPSDLAVMGCKLPPEIAERGVVYARANWSHG